MTLTRRRQQFLKQIVDDYFLTHEPVHYVTVAKALGVSKWTAYDMLKELERCGYLAADYQLNPDAKASGRSQILFRPTDAGIKALDLDTKPHGIYSWPRLKQDLLDMLSHKDPQSKIAELASKLKMVEGPFLVGAYTLIFLILEATSVVTGSVNMLRNAMVFAPTPDMTLLLFIGTALGLILNDGGARDGAGEVKDLVCRFQDSLSSISQREKLMLVDFLEDALNHNAD